MKKIYTKLLIISIICAVISFGIFVFSSMSNDLEFSGTQEVVNEVNEMGTDNPGAGWYLLIAGGTVGMVEIVAGIAILIIVIVIPSMMSLGIVISQCIARLVQIGQQKRWKDTTSKVFTYISIVLEILLCFVIILNLLSNLAFNRMLLLVALILNISCIALFIKELAKIKKTNKEMIENN